MDKRTIDAYDLYHEVYDFETKDFWEKFPESIITGFVNQLPGKRVLDLGSGPGRDALLLRDKGLDVVCVDGSKKMVEATRKLGFESRMLDFRELDFPVNTFDGIWAYSSLIHITLEESHLILQKLHGIIKQDGAVLLGLIQGDGNEVVSIGQSAITRYFEYYDRNKLNNLLEGTGFTIASSTTFKPGNQTYLNILLKKL